MDYKLVTAKHGWTYAKEVINHMQLPADGKDYLLVFALSPDKENQTAFANTVLALVMQKNSETRLRSSKTSGNLNCNVTTSENDLNHFWLLQARK